MINKLHYDVHINIKSSSRRWVRWLREGKEDILASRDMTFDNFINIELSGKKARLIRIVSIRCMSRICQIMGIDLCISNIEVPVSLISSCGISSRPTC